jgi:hypothetical protein
VCVFVRDLDLRREFALLLFVKLTLWSAEHRFSFFAKQ